MKPVSPWGYGGHSEGETPGSIPNPEAKPFSADGTALGTVWESRTPPDKLLTRRPTRHPRVGRFCVPWPVERAGGSAAPGPRENGPRCRAHRTTTLKEPSDG